MADAKFEPEVRLGLKNLKCSTPIAIECKKVEVPRLSFDAVSDHQVESLSEFQLSPFVKKIAVPAAVGKDKQRFNLKTEFDFVYCGPGKAYILVNFRFTRKPAGKYPKGLNKAFAVTIEQFKVAQAIFNEQGKKSLPLAWFEEYAKPLNRVKFGDKYGWDLSPIAEVEV